MSVSESLALVLGVVLLLAAAVMMCAPLPCEAVTVRAAGSAQERTDPVVHCPLTGPGRFFLLQLFGVDSTFEGLVWCPEDLAAVCAEFRVPWEAYSGTLVETTCVNIDPDTNRIAESDLAQFYVDVPLPEPGRDLGLGLGAGILAGLARLHRRR